MMAHESEHKRCSLVISSGRSASSFLAHSVMYGFMWHRYQGGEVASCWEVLSKCHLDQFNQGGRDARFLIGRNALRWPAG